MRALHRDVMRLSSSLLSPSKVLDYIVLVSLWYHCAAWGTSSKCDCKGVRMCMHEQFTAWTSLLQGLGSKNNRTKIECCEEIGCIIEREGMGPVVSCKSKPIVALAQVCTSGMTRPGSNVWVC